MTDQEQLHEAVKNARYWDDRLERAREKAASWTREIANAQGFSDGHWEKVIEEALRKQAARIVELGRWAKRWKAAAKNRREADKISSELLGRNEAAKDARIVELESELEIAWADPEPDAMQVLQDRIAELEAALKTAADDIQEAVSYAPDWAVEKWGLDKYADNARRVLKGDS